MAICRGCDSVDGGLNEDSIGILQAIADGRATNPDWDALLAVLPSIPIPATLEVTKDEAG